MSKQIGITTEKGYHETDGTAFSISDLKQNEKGVVGVGEYNFLGMKPIAIFNNGKFLKAEKGNNLTADLEVVYALKKDKVYYVVGGDDTGVSVCSFLQKDQAIDYWRTPFNIRYVNDDGTIGAGYMVVMHNSNSGNLIFGINPYGATVSFNLYGIYECDIPFVRNGY